MGACRLFHLFVVATLSQTLAAAAETVRVAAVQCPSVMGKTADNVARMVGLARKAAAQGARIVTYPECAVQGYLDPVTWTSWSDQADSGMLVQPIAETIPGPSTQTLGSLAKELDMYLCFGIIEVADKKYYNAQVLMAPDGTVAAHHRKTSLWTPGDAAWCSVGDRPVQVVPTRYGNLGLMICYEFHTLPPLLAKAGADIVLYSVGWYGPNEKDWFQNRFPRKSVVPHGFDVVVANWTSNSSRHSWPGRGHSCIISRNGTVLAATHKTVGSEIVITDLEVRKRQPAAAK